MPKKIADEAKPDDAADHDMQKMYHAENTLKAWRKALGIQTESASMKNFRKRNTLKIAEHHVCVGSSDDTTQHIAIWLKCGLRVNQKIGDMRLTPLMVLMQMPADERVRRLSYLIVSGADIQAANALGTTVLMHAVIAEDVGSVKVLLKAGARVNAQDKLGCTALHQAVFNCQRVTPLSKEAVIDPEVNKQPKYQILRLLLQHGASLDLEDCNGQIAEAMIVDCNDEIVMDAMRQAINARQQSAVAVSRSSRHGMFSQRRSAEAAVVTPAAGDAASLDLSLE